MPVTIAWTGNHGTGASAYKAYGRDHELSTVGVPTILGNADPTFRGNPPNVAVSRPMAGTVESLCESPGYRLSQLRSQRPCPAR